MTDDPGPWTAVPQSKGENKMTERVNEPTEPKQKSPLYDLFKYNQKRVKSFDELKEVYCKLFAERYFIAAAINLGRCCGLAGLSKAEKKSIIEEYRQKLEKGEVKDVKPGAQECTFKHLSNTWRVDPRTLQDLKNWLKEKGQYFIEEKAQAEK